MRGYSSKKNNTEDIRELLKTCTWMSDRHSDTKIVLSNWNV